MASDPEVWRGIAAEVALRWGVSLPDEHLAELARGLDAAAQRLAIGDATSCARALVAGQLDDARLAAIAGCLAWASARLPSRKTFP